MDTVTAEQEPTEQEPAEQEPADQPTEQEPKVIINNSFLCSCGIMVDISNRLQHELSSDHIYILYYNN
jgi:hypothetical protein